MGAPALAILLEKAGEKAKLPGKPSSSEEGDSDRNAEIAFALRQLKNADSDDELLSAWRSLKDIDGEG